MSDPTNANARGGRALRVEGHVEKVEDHAIVTPVTDERKRFATWQARAAMRGVELRRLEDGSFLASTHSWSRRLSSCEVETWLRLIGAPA